MSAQVLSKKQLDDVASSNGGFGDTVVYRDCEDGLMVAVKVSFYYDGRYNVVRVWAHEIGDAKRRVLTCNWDELLGLTRLGEAIKNGEAYRLGSMQVNPEDLCIGCSATGEFRFDPHTGWVIGARACAATPRDALKLTDINDAFPVRIRVEKLQDSYGDKFHGMTFALEELSYIGESGREVGPQSIFSEPSLEPQWVHAKKVGLDYKCVYNEAYK